MNKNQYLLDYFGEYRTIHFENWTFSTFSTPKPTYLDQKCRKRMEYLAFIGLPPFRLMECMFEEISFYTDVIEQGSIIENRYEIVRVLGSGAMGIVYLAHDRHNTALPVALKILHSELARNKSYVHRFLREARLMNLVDHRNVVRTFDVGSGDDLVYFALEYVEGVTLESVLDGRRFSGREISSIGAQIVEGLKAIHAHGIVHRDLRPGNVLLTAKNQVKIMDFGVAREEGSRLTKVNERLGSFCYIAPELWLGKTPTPAADFYSVGILLYELSTGALPFNGRTPGAFMTFHLDTAVTPPIERSPRVPKALNDLILQLLCKAPRRRLQSADAVIETLRALTRAEPQPERKPQTTTPSNDRLQSVRTTVVFDRSTLPSGGAIRRKRCNIAIPIPGRAALVFTFPAPSRDFILFGVFLISLQVFDGVLTSRGVERWGPHAEGNSLLRPLMLTFGPDRVLFYAKLAAILMVVFLTIIARRVKPVKNIIQLLSCVYLTAAILPWLYLLYGT